MRADAARPVEFRSVVAATLRRAREGGAGKAAFAVALGPGFNAGDLETVRRTYAFKLQRERPAVTAQRQGISRFSFLPVAFR